MARSFVDACGLLVRHLIRTVYSMTEHSVRPADQPAPTLKEGNEFATVKIISAPLLGGSFARVYEDQTYSAWDAATAYLAGAKVTRSSAYYNCILAVTGGTGPGVDTTHWAATTAPTKVVETIDGCYEFVASVQFFRHSDPGVDGVGLSPFGMSAFDKAARMESILALDANMELMADLGLSLVNVSGPRNVGALLDGAVWDDRGSVDLTLTVSNAETALIESIASAEIDVLFQRQSGQIDNLTIEVQP